MSPSYTLGSVNVTLRFTAPAGGLPPGEYELTIFSDSTRSLHDLSGIDLDGDGDGTPGGDYVRAFFIAPSAPTDLAISPDNGVSSVDGLTDTGSVTLSGRLPDSGLSVDVFDVTTHTDLGPAAVDGTSFSIVLNLPAGENELKVTDEAGSGNVSSPAYFDAVIDLTSPAISAIAGISPNPRNTSVGSVDVTFSKPINPATFSASSLVLTDNGGANLITNAVTISLIGGSSYEIDGLSGLTKSEGTYKLTVNASGIEDLAGNTGSGSSSISWLMDTTPPTSAVMTLPSETTSTSFTITASGTDPIGSNNSTPSGIATFGIYEEEDGGAFSLLTTVTPASPSVVFTGQAGHAYGFYSVATDNAGNVQTTPPGPQRTVQILSPLTVTSIPAVSPNPRTTPVSDVDAVFNLPIDTASLTAGAITLTDNGTAVDTSGVSLTLVAGTTSTYDIGNLSSLTATAGTYVLSINAADVNDLYGNAGAGSLSTTWVRQAVTPTVSWSNPADIVYGTALGTSQLDATASVAGAFSYSPADGAILRAGNDQSLSVTFTPTDTLDYTTASATVVINVEKATPTISWPTPADITYGTTLSGAQLDATSSWTIAGVSGGVAGTFTYTPAAGTLLHIGNSQTLSVSFAPTDSTDYATASGTTTINVFAPNQTTPTITWSKPASVIYGTPLSTTQLDATASVAGTFTYSPAVGTVLNAGNGQLLSVTFTPSDTTDYTSATDSTTIDVLKAAPALSWTSPASIVYGTALSATQLDASASVAGTFAYSPAVGTILNAGNGQTLSVSFTPSDTTDYTDATDATTIDVLKAAPSLSWTSPASIVYGTALSATQLDASASVAGSFAYSPAAGTILNAGIGQTLSVSFTPSDTTDYTGATDSTTIHVLKAAPALSWTSPASIVYGTALSATQLDASASVAGSFAYSPATGTVLKAGDDLILSVTFTPSDTTDYAGATDTTTIDVLKAAPALSWTSPASIVYGTALSATQLDASASVAGTFAYSPAAGIVLKAGDGQTLSVSFTPSDTTDYASATDSTTIDVLKAAPALSWTSPASIVYGTALSATQLDASASVAGTFAYSPPVGTILNAGNGQTLSVSFTPSDTTDYTDATDSTTIDVLKATPALSWTAPASIVYGTALSATQLDASASVAGSFAYSPAAGTILNASNGQLLSVTFTPSDTTDYTDATDTTTIDVLKATPALSWTAPASIVYGTALSATQLDASASVAGSFAYSPAAGTILNAGIGQTLSVSFTPSDTTDYTGATDSTTIHVLKAAPSLSWTALASIVYGTALSATQLDASASVAGSFAYSPTAGTILNAGNGQTLSVSFTPSDTTDYTGATDTTTIDVLKATPALSWTSPASIVYGTALSATQLDASASVAGSFAYSPTAGTILNAGNAQTLSVSFTPSDTTDYTDATDTTTIDVLKATPALSWTAPASIVYGTALSATQLDASASVAGTFTYSPAAGTILNAGNGQTLSVSFTPSDTTDYTDATDSTTIDVLKAAPALSWTSPASIVYGTALSATQLDASASVAGSFAYSPAAGTILNAGNGQLLSVTFTPSDTTDYTSATDSTTIDVLKAAPALSWTSPASIVYGTALSATQLDASASVAGTFAYSPAVGTILNAGNGQTLSVSFTPSDTTDYTDATDSTTIDVLKAAPSLSWTSPASIVYGTALSATQLDASASVAGTFAYSPAAGTVLKAGDGLLLSVSFTPSDTTDYTGATDSTTIDVLKATPALSWTAPASIVYGTALSATQLDASASVAGTFAYSPAAGTILNASNGQLLSVTFTPSDTTDYTDATDTTTIDVLKATPALSWTAPASIVYGTALSATQLDASASVAGTFAYSPAAGTILNAGNGQTLSVSFTPSDTTDYAGATDSTTIDVLKAAPALSWTSPASIVYGTALSATQLDASASVAGTFAYSPTAGTILNASNGQLLSVTFTPSDTTDYTDATDTTTIDVLKATPALSWTAPASIVYGTALSATQLDASASVAGTFAYSPAVGTILNAGNGQTLSVSFTPSDTTDYAGATDATTIDVLKAAPALSWTAPASIVYGTALSATQLDASASVAGTFAYSPAAGTVLKAGDGLLLSVTFTPSDTTDYTGATDTTTIDVLKAAPSLSWTSPASIVYGTALSATQLDASASVTGTFAYSPAAGTILNASNGQLLSVTFTPSDTTDYTNATDSTTIDVLKATPALSWTAPASIVYGIDLSATQLDASASVTGTFAYSPAAGTILNAGNAQTLSVSFTPSDTTDYTNATDSTTIDVLKATLALSWTAPASIVYGTALSATQLDASANIAGSFTYSPAVGTVLNAGNSQLLSVTFTPSDTTDYTGATDSTTIDVLKAAPSLSWTAPASIVYGTALSATQLDASASVAGTFAYSPAAGTILNASNGQLLSVTFTPSDTTDYTDATDTTAIDVLKAAPSLSWTAPASIVYGTALSATQLDASASVAGSFAYSPAAGDRLESRR